MCSWVLGRHTWYASHHLLLSSVHIADVCLSYLITARSLPVAVASCVVIGGSMGAFDAAGRLAGDRRDRESPESAEERRRRFFKQKPLQADS